MQMKFGSCGKANVRTELLLGSRGSARSSVAARGWRFLRSSKASGSHRKSVCKRSGELLEVFLGDPRAAGGFLHLLWWSLRSGFVRILKILKPLTLATGTFWGATWCIQLGLLTLKTGRFWGATWCIQKLCSGADPLFSLAFRGPLLSTGYMSNSSRLACAARCILDLFWEPRSALICAPVEIRLLGWTFALRLEQSVGRRSAFMASSSVDKP